MRFISIGPWCNTSAALKEANKRDLSYPFDWIFSCPDMIADCIRDSFNKFLDPIYLEDFTTDRSDHTYYKHIVRISQEYLLHHSHNAHEHGPIFNHHYLGNASVLDSYRRKCSRFMQALEDSTEPVILIYTQAYAKNMNDILVLSNVLMQYPHVYILCLQREVDKEKHCLVHPPSQYSPNVLVSTFYVECENNMLGGGHINQLDQLLNDTFDLVDYVDQIQAEEVLGDYVQEIESDVLGGGVEQEREAIERPNAE